MNQPVMLVVDDEAGVRQSLQLVFNKVFRVIEATSAADAIQKATDERPDVVLLDIMMPGTDGLEVLKQMRSVQPDCQIIMLSALNTARAAFTAKGTGAFDYVTKPFDVEELRMRVERAMEKVVAVAGGRAAERRSRAQVRHRARYRKIIEDHRRVQGGQHGGGEKKHRAHNRRKRHR